MDPTLRVIPKGPLDANAGFVCALFSSQQKRLTIDLLCGADEKKKTVARRLQALFGLVNHAEVAVRLTAAFTQKYEKMLGMDDARFRELCIYYVPPLLMQESFNPVSGSPLKNARKLDGLDLPSTLIVDIKRYLPVTPMPQKLILDNQLNRIVLEGRLEHVASMKTFCSEVVARRIEAVGLLCRIGDQRLAQALTLDPESLLDFEISWNRHTPIPGRSCIQLFNDWGRTGENQGRIVQLLFNGLLLSPLIHSTIAGREGAQPLILYRATIDLDAMHTFGYFLGGLTIEVALDQILHIGEGPVRREWIGKYAPLFQDPAIQSRSMVAILEAAGDYLKKKTADDRNLTSDQIHLETTRSKLDALFSEHVQRPDAYHFVFSMTLLTYLETFIDFTSAEKFALFESLYNLDPAGREAIFDCFMRKVDKHLFTVLLGYVNKKKESFDLDLAEKGRFLVFLLRVAGQMPSRFPLDKEPQSHYSLFCFHEDQERLHQKKWPRALVSRLLEAQFIDPDFIDFCRHCASQAQNGVPWFEHLMPLLRVYSPFHDKISNAMQYNQLADRLRSAKEALKAHFPHQKPPLYHSLLSWVLAWHMEQLQETSLEERTAWIKAFNNMREAKRAELAEELARPHYDWPQRTMERLPLSELFEHYGFTEEERAILRISYALDGKNLRPFECPAICQKHENQLLNFGETCRLLREVESSTQTLMTKEAALHSLKWLCIPSRFLNFYQQWRKLSAEVRLHRARVFMPSKLMEEITDFDVHLPTVTMTCPAMTVVFNANISDSEENLEREPGKNNAMTRLFCYFGNLLNQALLPTAVHTYPQRLLLRLIPSATDAVSERQRRWIDVHRCQLLPLADEVSSRAIFVEDRIIENHVQLTIRLVKSLGDMTTKSIKTLLPGLHFIGHEKQLLFNPQLIGLAAELCDLICNERITTLPDVSQEPQYELPFLEWMLKPFPQLATRVDLFRRADPSHERMLGLLVGVFRDLKLQMREDFWEFVQRRPVRHPVNELYMAGRGHLCQFAQGISLIPLPEGGQSPSPHFTILFQQYRGNILKLQEDLVKSYRCARQGLFELVLKGDNTELHLVNVSLTFVRGRCVESYDEISEIAPEIDVDYHEVNLSLERHPDVFVVDRIFQRMSDDELVLRFCWLLALLKSEWYGTKIRGSGE